MLVMTMRRQEVIYIGETIRVTVVELLPGKVRIGVDAPKSIVIHRGQFTDMKGAFNDGVNLKR